MLFLPVMLVFIVLAWFLVFFREFALAAILKVEGGFAWGLDYFEAWWEGVRMSILLVVGVLCAGFFVFSAIVGFLAHKREVKDG